MDDNLPPRFYFLAPDNASQAVDLEKREDILRVLSGLCAMEGVEMTTLRSKALAQAMNDVGALPPERRSIEALIEFVREPEDALRAALLRLARSGQITLFHGSPEQTECPQCGTMVLPSNHASTDCALIGQLSRELSARMPSPEL